tara:strand:- start:52 stop:297 length:246 start_codon:yes stop_codon:yes gene_type:complete
MTNYKTVDVEVEVEITYEDILEYFECANENTLKNLSEDLEIQPATIISRDKSLDGQMKMESIVNHWDKFTESEFENWIKNK